MARRVSQKSVENALSVLARMMKKPLAIYQNTIYMYEDESKSLGKSLVYGTRSELFSHIHFAIKVLENKKEEVKEVEPNDTDKLNYLNDIVSVI